MTAENAGKAAEGPWGTVRRLRDRWLLLVFITGALMWLRDGYERIARLPADLAEQGAEVAALERDVARLDAALAREAGFREDAVMEFPGSRHGVEDGRAGDWTVARLIPARPLRTDCRTVRVDAWMIDATGRWFSVETGLGTLPTLTEDTDLAFGVRLHEHAAAGRAQVLLQLSHQCGAHLQVQVAPRLQFRVIAD